MTHASTSGGLTKLRYFQGGMKLGDTKTRHEKVSYKGAKKIALMILDGWGDKVLNPYFASDLRAVLDSTYGFKVTNDQARHFVGIWLKKNPRNLDSPNIC